MNIFSFSKASSLFLIYSLFALICHTTFILLLMQTSKIHDPNILFHLFFPMIEHSLMSFVIILIGVTAFEYIDKKIE